MPQEGPGLGESVGFSAEELSNPSAAGWVEDRVQWAGLEEVVLLAPLRVFDIFPWLLGEPSQRPRAPVSQRHPTCGQQTPPC